MKKLIRSIGLCLIFSLPVFAGLVCVSATGCVADARIASPTDTGGPTTQAAGDESDVSNREVVGTGNVTPSADSKAGGDSAVSTAQTGAINGTYIAGGGLAGLGLAVVVVVALVSRSRENCAEQQVEFRKHITSEREQTKRHVATINMMRDIYGLPDEVTHH